MHFEVLIDDSLLNLDSLTDLIPANNKHVLSLINDYEGGKWRFLRFENFVWDNIALTTLSLREREKLVDQSHTKLVACAKNLRLTDKLGDPGKGSELAEIVLYAIMHHHYGALPVVPKIFYKQNAQDYAKGADGVHIVVDANNDFTLWFGEAKFYNSIEDARLASIVDSVANSLVTDKLKKENSIITSTSDLEGLILDPDLLERVRAALSNHASIDVLKPRLHIPILLLHECEITFRHSELSDSYRKEIKDHHLDRAKSYFQKQVKLTQTVHKYNEITFHVILFPVPARKQVVEDFVANVSHYKSKGEGA